jgi:hypothetical protein
MVLTTSEQLVLGLWLAMAGFIGVEQHAWEPAFGPILMAIFFAVPMVAKRLVSAGGSKRRLAIAMYVAFAAVLLLALAGFVERLYYFNSSSYPAWMTRGHLKRGDFDRMVSECREHDRGPVEGMARADGGYTVRCGFVWPFTITYTADPDFFVAH